MQLHCNGKNLKSQISLRNLDRIDFFYKTDWLSLTLLYMWVEDEFIWMRFCTQNKKNRVLEIFAIVNPIVILKILATIES